MAISGTSAIEAIKSQHSSAPSTNVTAAPQSAPASFADTLGQVVNSAMDTLQAGEVSAIQGVQGGLPAFKVVEGIMGAQRVLQQGLAIRDKAVSAYQEISHLAI